MKKIKELEINRANYITFGKDTCIGFRNIEEFENTMQTINQLVKTVNLLSEAKK